MQGSTQCCVTGLAFEQMVQYGSPSLVEAVMNGAAVFARMRSQQKGQVMDLLGQRGLYRGMGRQQHLPVRQINLKCLFPMETSAGMHNYWE